MKTETKLQLRVRSIAKHYWPFICLHPYKQIVLLLCYGLSSFLTAVAVPLIYKGIMDVISSSPENATTELRELMIWLVLVVVVYNIFFRIADHLLVSVQSNALKGLYDYALTGLQKKSYTFYANTFTGSIVAKVKRFVRAFETLHDQFIFHVWMQSIALVSSVVVLWYHSWELGLFFLLWLVGYAVLVRYMVKWTIPKMLTYAESDSDVTGHLSDIITNMLTVKMFAASGREQASFERTTTKQNTKRIRAWMQDGFWNSMYQGVTVGVFEIGVVVGVIVLWNMQIAGAGLVLLVVVYVLRSFAIVWTLSKNVINISTALTDANEMTEVLDGPITVVDPVDPETSRITAGHVVFDKVSHAYEENSYRVFNRLNIDIAPGEKVAFVGHSGAGKTTVVKLLLRFLDIEYGTITIDGQDIRNITQDALRRHVAYVPQEPILFHRTLFENIAYGKPNAARGEVETAAKRAHVHDFISKLPQGYETLVGERGVKLSGGERQRVAIARAMLKEAPIVVLDEATSSLDSVSEKHIQAAFDELMEGRTTIVIAHRLSTTQHMDRIIVLGDGGLAESGTHSELLVKNGIYAQLWNSQVGGFMQDKDDVKEKVM